MPGMAQRDAQGFAQQTIPHRLAPGLLGWQFPNRIGQSLASGYRGKNFPSGPVIIPGGPPVPGWKERAAFGNRGSPAIEGR